MKFNRGNYPIDLLHNHQQFTKLIQGKSVEEAYNIYKKNKNKIKFMYKTVSVVKSFKIMTKQRCSICSKLIYEFDDEITIEHIELKREEPSKIFLWDNLLPACRTCNTKRSIKKYDPSLYCNPTKQDIIDLLDLNIDGSFVLRKGKEKFQSEYLYTTELYKLNRYELCELRCKNLELHYEDDTILKKLDEKNLLPEMFSYEIIRRI